jgi:hypothetical protein
VSPAAQPSAAAEQRASVEQSPVVPQVEPSEEVPPAVTPEATPAPADAAAPQAEGDAAKAPVGRARVISVGPKLGEAETPPDSEPESDNQAQVARAARPFAIAGVLGWNSLVGFGIEFSYAIIPQLTIEVAGGLGAIGFKTGARLRYNMLESNWTPVLGVGMQYGPGSGGEVVTIAGEDGGAQLQIEPSAYAQGIVGVNFQGRGGFTFLAGVVYSHLLDKSNVSSATGGSETIEATRLVAGSGFGAEFAFGYAF